MNNMQLSDEQLFEKSLPAAPDAERLILGSVLVGHPIENVTSVLRASDFSLEKHRRIFSAMVHLESSGAKVDRVTLAHEIRRRGQLESVDGLSYLASLDEGMPVLRNVDAYLSIVRDKAVLRQAIMTWQAAIDECLAAADPTPDILARAESALASLATETRSASFRSPLEVITRAGGINAFLNPEHRSGGVETPWPLLNRMLAGRGFVPGQMVVIGARPSMGKTALACQIADCAATNGTGVAFFTLEMPDRDILQRMAAARAQVDSLKVKQGLATLFETQGLSEAYTDLADDSFRLWIDDTTGCTVPAMRAALRRLSAKHQIGLVVIDYLQLVETSGGSERRYEQVSEISRGMKRLAREFNVPVVVLAQLNRDMEKDSRKPRPSDLRDSGSIEQDADIILMPAKQGDQDEHADTLMIDLIIAKQRNGPLGIVPLKFLKRYAKFIEPPKAGVQAA